jgi:hypothetical protein
MSFDVVAFVVVVTAVTDLDVVRFFFFLKFDNLFQKDRVAILLKSSWRALRSLVENTGF